MHSPCNRTRGGSNLEINAMTDKIKSEFSKWAASEFQFPESMLRWTGESADDGYPVRLINKNGDQTDEANSIIGACWIAWQASRAALVVELPPTISHCNTLGSGFVMPEAASYDEAIEDCREALTKAGVTVK